MSNITPAVSPPAWLGTTTESQTQLDLETGGGGSVVDAEQELQHRTIIITVKCRGGETC